MHASALVGVARKALPHKMKESVPVFEAVGETIRKTVALNDAFFGNSINVLSHFFQAAWTLLWAIVSLVVAVATLCLNAVAGLVSLVPQV